MSRWALFEDEMEKAFRIVEENNNKVEMKKFGVFHNSKKPDRSLSVCSHSGGCNQQGIIEVRFKMTQVKFFKLLCYSFEDLL